MDRAEKLKLSAEPEAIYFFRQGLFAKLYEQSLWRFINRIKPLKPMIEKVKGGAPIIYGGLPWPSLETLLNGGQLPEIRSLDYGWLWPYQSQAGPEQELTAYEDWRSGVIAEAKTPPPLTRDVLAEIAAFNLGVHTPMEAMNAVLGWQNFLKNREGTG